MFLWFLDVFSVYCFYGMFCCICIQIELAMVSRVPSEVCSRHLTTVVCFNSFLDVHSWVAVFDPWPQSIIWFVGRLTGGQYVVYH